VMIEAEAMKRTLPAKIELQRMQNVLYPPQSVVNFQAGLTQQQGLNPGQAETVSADGLFDWNSLKDADRHPMLGLIAKMGGGKSLLAKYLGRHVLGGDVIVFDIYGNKKDWQGCDVLFDYEDIVLRMSDDNAAIEDDMDDYRSGKRDFKPQLVVLEEGKVTLPRLQKLKLSREGFLRLQAEGRVTTPGQIVQDWKLNYESLTRKIKRRLCLVSTNMNSSVLGINGETRDEITMIFPGLQGIGKAMKDTSMLKLGARQNQVLRDRLITQLKGIKYPALVYHDGDWFAAEVPELDENGNPAGATQQPIAPPVVSPSTQPLSIEDLNRLINLEVDDENRDH
jgi:hypothetical protein